MPHRHPRSRAMDRQHYLVTGMTCEHCSAAITREVSRVPGADEVAVDLAAGTVSVRGRDLDDVLLRAAIAEAGYVAGEALTV
jgi:copper chaperone